MMLGWKELPYEVMHPGEFYYDLMKEGKIKIARKIKEPVTLQDPCNIIRRAGDAAEKFRYIVNATCEDFREMYPNRQHNFCCNAGGGLAALSQWKKHKAKGNRVKMEQIKATGAKICITPCHNCNRGITDVIECYDEIKHVKTMFFDELLVKTMEIPKKFWIGEEAPEPEAGH
ncbi:MAG: heterodisulfide reductase-related iron-sulfur binding cluster [Nitrospirota bacterium]